MLDPTAYDLCCGVSLAVVHFYSDANRFIYEAIGALHDEGQPVDAVTIAASLANRGRMARVGGPRYLAQIMDATPAIGHVETHAELVRDFGRRRQLIATLQTKAAEGYSELEGTTQQWIEEVENTIGEVAHLYTTRFGPKHIKGAAGDAYQNAHDASNDKLGASTGLERLDKKIAALQAARLYVVAARPGMGKTSLATDIGIAVAQAASDNGLAKAVCMFSLEMDAASLAMRMICSHERLDSHRISQNYVRNEEWDSLANGVAWLSKLPLWIDEQPALTIAEIRSRARKLRTDIEAKRSDVEADELGLVIVDYIQLMAGDPRAPREERVAANAMGLKALSKELGVPVMALAQLNRSVEQRPDKRPLLSDLRESGAIEQEADCVIFIYRDEVYDKESADKGIAELIVGKQRHGPTGTAKVKFTAQYTRFDNLTDDEYDFEFEDGEQGDFDKGW
jgi:replicative DNA helicase